MNTKAWIGFFAGAIIASAGFYFVSHLQPASTPAAVNTSAAPVSVAATETAASESPAKRAVRKNAAPAADADPGSSRFVGTPPLQAAALQTTPLQTAPLQAATESAPQPIQQDTAARAPAPDPPPPPGIPAPAPPIDRVPEPPHSVTIAANTLLSVRLNDKLSTQRNQTGDAFSATLDQPLVADGFVIAERGAHVDGRVVQAEQAGRVKGVARLVLELTRIDTSDSQKITLHTESFEKLGPETKGEDAAKIGAGAVLGAIIGAVAGGGKGAAVGAGAGGAAGTGTVMATRGKPAELPSETRISFKIEQPVTITEQQR